MKIDKKAKKELKLLSDQKPTALDELLPLIRQRITSISNETPLQTGANIRLEDIKKAFE